MAISQEVIDKFDVKPVGLLKDLKGYIKFFSGKKTYEEALIQAHEWRDEINSKPTKVADIEFVNYFPQEFGGKSILIGFKFV